MTEAEQQELERLREENRELRDRLLEDEYRAEQARWRARYRAIAPE